MANITYKNENQGFSFHASDIGGVSNTHFNTPYQLGTVKAGQNNGNKVGKSNNNNTNIDGESYIKSTDITEETFNLNFKNYPNNSLGTLYKYGQFIVGNMIGVTPPIDYGNGSEICNTLPKRFCPIGTTDGFSMVFPLAQYAGYGSRFDIYWSEQDNTGKISFYSSGGDATGNVNQGLGNTCGGLTDDSVEVVSL